MRRPFTTEQAMENGMTSAQLRWGVSRGTFQRVFRGVYLRGGAPPSSIETALATVVVTDGVASGTLAGLLYGLDGVELRKSFVTVPNNSGSRMKGLQRRDLDENEVHNVRGYKCVSPLHAMLGMASPLNDLEWEQALESALRKRLLTIGDIEQELTWLHNQRVAGTATVRRVLKLRPAGAPHTDSILETLMIQLVRKWTDVPEPARQIPVHTDEGVYIGRVDLGWTDVGVFLELDGQQHKGQPVYDARRQTAIVAAKKWFTGRFMWDDVVDFPEETGQRVMDIYHGAAELRSRKVA